MLGIYVAHPRFESFLLLSFYLLFRQAYFTNTDSLLSTLFGATDARRRRHSVCVHGSEPGMALPQKTLSASTIHAQGTSNSLLIGFVHYSQNFAKLVKTTLSLTGYQTFKREFCSLLYMQSRAQLADEEEKMRQVF